MKKKTIAGLAALGAVLGAATAAGIIVRKRKQKMLGSGAGTPLPPKRNIYFAGGGIAALSGAFYLIHDCGIPGDSIYIFEASSTLGGSFNIGGSGDDGYITAMNAPFSLDGRSNMADMLSKLPSGLLPDMSVADEIRNFENANPLNGFSRLVDKNCLETDDIALSKRSLKQIKALLSAKEDELFGVSVQEFFDGADFLSSGLWGVVSTSYMIKPSSAALELKNILSMNSVDELINMKNTVRSQLNMQETVVGALERYLVSHNVNFSTHCRVVDLDLDESSGRVCAIHLNDNGTAKTFYLNKRDLCFVTNGSASECATVGDFNYPAPEHEDASASFALWRNISEKHSGFGDPGSFFSSDDSDIISFTVTSRSPLLPDLIKQYASGSSAPGTLTTFTDSPWGMTVMCPPQPYFSSQDENTFVICGYGINTQIPGRYTDKEMKNASGAEILFELVKLLGLGERWEEITDTIVNVIPCCMPFAAASSLPHEDGDKPLAVPFKDGNIAFIGRFARLGCGISCSCEYSVRTAREAAYRLTGTKKAAAAPRRNMPIYRRFFIDLKNR